MDLNNEAEVERRAQERNNLAMFRYNQTWSGRRRCIGRGR
jgi:hypothetical protein